MTPDGNRTSNGPDINPPAEDLTARLRREADELWPKGMEPVPGVEYEATAKRVCDLMREAAKALGEAESERTAAAIKALQGEVVASYLKPMFRWIHGRCYFDGHGFSVQHGSVQLNEQGTAHLAAIDDIPLWRSE